MKLTIIRASAVLFVAALILGFIAGGVSSVFNAEVQQGASRPPVVLQGSPDNSDTPPAGDAPVSDDDDKHNSLDITLNGNTTPSDSPDGDKLLGGIHLPGVPGDHILMGNGNNNNNNNEEDESSAEDTTESSVEDSSVSEPEEDEDPSESVPPVEDDTTEEDSSVTLPEASSSDIINTILSRPYTNGIDTFGNISSDTAALYDAIKSGSNRCSFIAYRISDGASITYNVDRNYRCASAYKSFAALYAYKQAAAGVYDLNTGIKYTSADYYSGSGVIKNSPFGTIYTLRQVANYSIRYSDNAGFIMLQRYLDRKGLVDYAKELGCPGADEFQYTWPDITALDAAIWWADIYEFAQSSSYGEELYSVFLNATQPSIKKGLNNEHAVAHKSGSMSYYFHDCGIVESEDPYILVLLTYNPNNYSSDNQAYFSSVVQEIDKIINP